MKIAILLIFLLTNFVSAQTQLMWSEPIAINNGSELSFFSAAYCQLNNAGVALATWPNLSGSNSLLFSAFSNDFGRTWSMPQQLTPSNEDYLFSQSGGAPPLFPLNQQGRSAICWIDRLSSTSQLNIKAALFDSSSGWDVATIATFAPPPDFPFDSFIRSAAIGNNNFSVVIWMEYNGVDYDIKSAYNDGTNSSWTPVATAVKENGDQSVNPLLGMSPSGEHLFISWRETTTIERFLLKVSSFNFDTYSWSSPLVIASNVLPSSVSYPLVNDSGHVLIPWAKQDGLDILLQAATFDGSTWTPHSLDTTNFPNDFSFNPFSGISWNANNHASFSWAVEDVSSSSAIQKISYFNGSTWSSPFTFSESMLAGSGSFPFSVLNELDQIFLIFEKNGDILGSFFPMPPSFSGIMSQPLDTNSALLAYGSLSLNNSDALACWFRDNMNNTFSVQTGLCSAGIWTVFPVPGATSPSNPTFFSFPWIRLSDNGAAIVAWGQEGSTNFFVSNNGGGSSGPLPPSGGSGFQTSTLFLISTDLINVLSWTPSPTPGVSYKIYRNGKLVGTSDKPSFNDHQQIPKQTATYSITAVGASGEQSSPLVFVVTP